jgi:hypothetical protein
MDAMALGIPVVSFKNNYMRLFDQTDWSPAEEFIDIPDLIVQRGNFKQLKSLVSKLIDDPGYRLKIGEACEQKIHSTKGNPERMVRKCENIYVEVIRRKVAQMQSSGLNHHPPPLVKRVFHRFLGE